MAGPDEGFERWVYLTNEESDAVFDGKPGTFSPLGGQSVAIFKNEAHALSRLGHFSKENDIVRPGTGSKTVIFSLEDGPTTPDSQLYMYVGTKRPAAGSVLGRNGLNNGTLYVFVADDAGSPTETEFQTGTLDGHWVPIPDAGTLSDVDLEAAADALGAFGFFRIEDGAFSPNSDDEFIFVTTGEGPVGTNRLGRVYQLHLDPASVTGDATLEIVVNADRVFDPDGDGVYDTSGAVDAPLSPDNIDASGSYLMVQEDGTSPTRTVMTALGRDGQIWRFGIDGDGNVDGASGEPIAELNPPGWVVDPVTGVPPAVTPGRWETSGIIDGSRFWGADSWLFDVQAHPPSLAPGSNLVEDGQLLLLLPSG